MATKVFISWSGDLSHKLAEVLRNWLPAALQYVKPYFSPEDIEKGAKWNSEIAKELESSDIGIICLTQDNIEKPWILFEAGALSKTLDKSRVCTLLFDLEATDLKGPLTSFQATKFVPEDFKRLIGTINNSAGDSKLESDVLDSVFDMWWSRLEKQVEEILKTHEKGSKKERRSERDILEEVLELTRMNAERAHRFSKVHPGAVKDLVENIEEMFNIIYSEHPGIGFELRKRLASPLAYLCDKAGSPELFKNYDLRKIPRDHRIQEMIANEKKTDQKDKNGNE